jgi:hypothetical protein
LKASKSGGPMAVWLAAGKLTKNCAFCRIEFLSPLCFPFQLEGRLDTWRWRSGKGPVLPSAWVISHSRLMTPLTPTRGYIVRAKIGHPAWPYGTLGRDTHLFPCVWMEKMSDVKSTVLSVLSVLSILSVLLHKTVKFQYGYTKLLHQTCTK